MKIVTFDNQKNLETHNFFIKIIRIISVPLLNVIPAFVLQRLMKSTSQDAGAVVDNAGRTHALEAMYTRYHRNLFSRGIFQGLADLFWHHLISQPKALRNRLKIVEQIFESEVRRLIAEREPRITVLTVGGGSARAIIETLHKIFKERGNHLVQVINIDRDAKATESGRELAAKYGLGKVFEWINDDARSIGSQVPAESVDVVEMVGLLDYFSDEKGSNIIKNIYQSLKPGGLFITANVYPNSEMGFVERTGWPLMYYREPADMARILAAAGFSAQPVIIYEPLKVHIIATVKK